MHHSDQVETIITDDSPVAQVAHLRILSASLVPKEGHVVPSAAEMRALLGPEMEEYLDEEAEQIQSAVEKAYPSGHASGSRVIRDQSGELEAEQMDATVGRKGDWVAVGSVTGYNGPSRKGKEREVFATLEDEVRACFHNLRGQSSAWCPKTRLTQMDCS